MDAFPSGGLAIPVESDQIGREVGLVNDPAPELLWVVDAIILRNSGGDIIELGPRQNAENSVRNGHQGLVE